MCRKGDHCLDSRHFATRAITRPRVSRHSVKYSRKAIGILTRNFNKQETFFEAVGLRHKNRVKGNSLYADVLSNAVVGKLCFADENEFFV